VTRLERALMTSASASPVSSAQTATAASSGSTPTNTESRRKTARRASSWPRQGALGRRLARHFLEAENLDAPRRKLDRQSDAVELAADGAHDGGLRVAELETQVVGGHALHKKLHGRICQSIARCQTQSGDWRGEGLYAIHKFAPGPQSFPTGREHAHTRRRHHQRLRQLRGGIDDPLAGIEHDERLARSKMSDHAFRWTAVRRGEPKLCPERLSNAFPAVGPKLA
jgi:hypothetical protein